MKYFEITISYKGKTRTFRADEKERFVVNEIYKEFKLAKSKHPIRWAKEVEYRFHNNESRVTSYYEQHGIAYAAKDALYHYAAFVNIDFYNAIRKAYKQTESAIAEEKHQYESKEADLLTQSLRITTDLMLNSTVSIAANEGRMTEAQGRDLILLATCRVLQLNYDGIKENGDPYDYIGRILNLSPALTVHYYADAMRTLQQLMLNNLDYDEIRKCFLRDDYFLNQYVLNRK